MQEIGAITGLIVGGIAAFLAALVAVMRAARPVVRKAESALSTMIGENVSVDAKVDNLVIEVKSLTTMVNRVVVSQAEAQVDRISIVQRLEHLNIEFAKFVQHFEATWSTLDKRWSDGEKLNEVLHNLHSGLEQISQDLRMHVEWEEPVRAEILLSIATLEARIEAMQQVLAANGHGT